MSFKLAAVSLSLVATMAFAAIPESDLLWLGPTISSQPSLDAATLQAFLTGRRSVVLKLCFEKHGQNQARWMTARFELTPTGRSSNVSIQSTPHDDGLESCLKTLMRSWAYPVKPNETATIVWPIHFEPPPSPPGSDAGVEISEGDGGVRLWNYVETKTFEGVVPIN